MLCLTLTVANNVPDNLATELGYQLTSSLNAHPDAVRGDLLGFRPVGQRQVQGFIGSAEQAVGFILSAARSANIGVHLMIAPRSENIFQQDGRDDVRLAQLLKEASQVGTAALRAPGGVQVVKVRGMALLNPKVAPELGSIESTLQLLSSIERRRSEEGQEAGLLINAGKSQSQAAHQLGVSQQAVSARLHAGYWYESRKVAYWIAAELEQLIHD